MNYEDLIREQHTFFETGNTRSILFRKKNLEKLRAMLVIHEKELIEAVQRDLHKPEMEVVSAEIITILEEIDLHLKKLDSWAKPEKVWSNMISIPSKNEIRRMPFGVSLIIGAWNYPINLLLLPLVGAISGGNCAILKPSELAPATSSLIRRMISGTFGRSYIHVVEGGVDVNQQLLDQSFDKIFFTGSSRVGKIVMGKG